MLAARLRSARLCAAKCVTPRARRSSLLRRSFATQSHQELQEFAANHMAHGIARSSSIVLDKGVGSYVYDVDGNKYLDFTCGIAVTSTGHCHPRVVKAAQEQCGKIIHSQVNIYLHQPMLELTSRMLKHLPPNLDRIFYANSGAEAVENAVKMARAYTKKQNIVVMDGGFHGRTLGTLALTTSKNVYRAGFGPLPSGVVVAPYPYCYRCPTKNCNEQTKSDPNYCCNSWEAQWEDLFHKQTAASEVAAVLIEPILGEGGYVVPPKSFMQFLRKFCSDNHILLIADEVQSGFLRTGKWWGYEHFDIVPDVVIIAKGIASGFPLSAVASSTEVMKACAPGTLGGTYTGNAVSCAAAIATIDVLEDENIADNVQKRGTELVTGLKLLQRNKNYHIGDVRGKGLMIAIEFDVSAPKGIAGNVTKNCLANGLFLLTTGAHETIRIIPPLTVTKSEIQDALEILRRSLDKAFA